MGSSRLPGKVLMEIDSKPLLKLMYERVNKAKLIDKIIIATTLNEIDEPIVDLCKKNNYEYYRGSENDVLDRYYQAALLFKPKTVIRLTADCPLCDPILVDRTIKFFYEQNVDFVSNTVPPNIKKYPDGTDVEVFSFKLLKLAWKNSTDKEEREHVTFYFWKSNNNFSTAILSNKYDWGKYRITIDYKEDFICVKEIIKILKEKNQFGSTKEIVNILDNHPNIFKLNSKYISDLKS